jgi:hypothetical protein
LEDKGKELAYEATEMVAITSARELPLPPSLIAGASLAVLLLAHASGVFANPLGASACDFNDDGFDDLAVGIPGESIAEVPDMGAVLVLYGSAGKLVGTGSQLWHQNSSGITGAGELNDRFGEAIACGDFDGNGSDDLAVGVPSEDFGGLIDAGAVQVIYGARTGLSSAGAQNWTQDTSGVVGVAESRDRFGSAVATGDFNDDGYDDLAVGAPVERFGSDISLAGGVNVFYGGPNGLSATGDQVFTQGTSGVTGVAESRDLFGFALASGDFDQDGSDDLAVGVPGENVGDFADAGAINVLYGGPAGLTATGDQVFTQDTTGIGGVAESRDQMGWSLATGDFNDDGREDLAIGAPGEAVGDRQHAGAVLVLYGSNGGLTAAGDLLLTQDTTGVLGDAEAYDRFGSALVAADFDGDGRDDLGAAAPLDSVAGVPEIGTVNVLYGSANGITPSGSQFWHQDITGVLGSGQSRDWFGEALAAGDYDGDGRADLVAAAPGESIGGVTDAGVLNVLYGTAAGLGAVGDQVWQQDSTDVFGQSEYRDRMGGRLRSDGVYRVPYETGTEVRVSADRLNHSPQQDRLDMSGVNAGPDYTIVAARAGTIEFIVDGNSEPTSSNNYVWMSHSDGEWTKYTHFATGSVGDAGRFVGEEVSAGTPLGVEGDVGQAQGEHLHFEVAVPYDDSDPINGQGFIKGENRDPLICGIPGNTLMAGETYTASGC